jgi:PAS domain S-box-containing protein
MADAPSLIRSLTLRYILALTLVGSLATTAFLFLHKVILRHENEAAVVNLSGRQRMLSQRITLAVAQAVGTNDAAERQSWLAELVLALDLMERSHEALTKGDAALNISPELAASIGPLYAERPAEVSRQVAEFLADGRTLVAAGDRIDKQNPAYVRILARSSAMLSGLDDIVGRYQAEVEHRVRGLERLEMIVWIVTLLVLALEAVLIFRPMIRRVRLSLDEETEKRAAAEQQVVSDQRRTEALVDTIVDAVVTIDQDGLIQTFSPSAERMFGWPRRDVQGQDFGILMPEPFRQRHKSILRHYLEGGSPRVIGIGLEVKGQRRDGGVFPLELALGEWNDGGRRFFTAVLRDITQRKALEESVRRAQKMEVIGQFSGGVAHDFNNLLGIISGNLELLEDRLRDDPKMLKRIEVAQHAAARGADLTRKLLSFSGSHTSQPQAVDVNALILSSKDLLDRLQTDRVAVTLSLADGLLPVRIDPGEFEDALLNLALNARDAMPQGGTLNIETANLTAEESPDGPRVVISVTDTGVGIPFESQKIIFEPFFTSKPPGKGTGLGLVTVDSFVKRSKGTLHLYSQPGQGTTFRIELPAIAAVQSAVVDAIVATPGGTETLLVVDDEKDLRTLLCTQLENLGYRCLSARDGVEALRLLDAEPAVSLLVSDIIMPGPFDGVALAQRALAKRPDLKILLSTGFAGRTEPEIRMLVPGAAMIAKPYRRHALAMKVRTLLDDVDAL